MCKDQSRRIDRGSLYNPSDSVVRCSAHDVVAADDIHVVHGPDMEEVLATDPWQRDRLPTSDHGQTGLGQFVSLSASDGSINTYDRIGNGSQVYHTITRNLQQGPFKRVEVGAVHLTID